MFGFTTHNWQKTQAKEPETGSQKRRLSSVIFRVVVVVGDRWCLWKTAYCDFNAQFRQCLGFGHGTLSRALARLENMGLSQRTAL